MDLTYSESQTALFSPHNTECDGTVGIINMYATKNLHCQPMFNARQNCAAKSSKVLLVKRQAKIIGRWQIMETNVMFQAVQGM